MCFVLNIFMYVFSIKQVAEMVVVAM